MKKIQQVLASILGCLILLTGCGQTAPTWQEQYDLGLRYLSEGNYEEAIIAFTAAIEIDPKQPLAYVGRGNAYIGSGETSENLTAALADYEKALELDETLADVYVKLADIYISMQDRDAAIATLLRGKEITGNEDILTKLDALNSRIDVLDRLIESFAHDDPNSTKEIIRSDEFWKICVERGTPMESKFKMLAIYYVNPADSVGVYINATLDKYEGAYGAECYYGQWNEDMLEGEGIVCIYMGPVKETDYDHPHMNYENWTFTHTNFQEGLANGYCERVHEGYATEMDGTVKSYTQTVCGNTSNGLWNGTISDVRIYEDGEMLKQEGYVKNGMSDDNIDNCDYDDVLNGYRTHDPVSGMGSFIIRVDSEENSDIGGNSNGFAVRVLEQDKCLNLWR